MTDNVTDHLPDHVTGHLTDHVTDHVTGHLPSHVTGHLADHVTGQREGRRTCGSKALWVGCVSGALGVIAFYDCAHVLCPCYCG